MGIEYLVIKKRVWGAEFLSLSPNMKTFELSWRILGSKNPGRNTAIPNQYVIAPNMSLFKLNFVGHTARDKLDPNEEKEHSNTPRRY